MLKSNELFWIVFILLPVDFAFALPGWSEKKVDQITPYGEPKTAYEGMTSFCVSQMLAQNAIEYAGTNLKHKNTGQTMGGFQVKKGESTWEINASVIEGVDKNVYLVSPSEGRFVVYQKSRK